MRMSSDTTTTTTTSATLRVTSSPHLLYGMRLWMVRALWLVLIVAVMSLFALAVPARYHELLAISPATNPAETTLRFTVSPESKRVPLQLSEREVRVLGQLGVPISSYAAYVVTLETVLVLGSALVGLGIFLRRSNEWIAILSALTFVLFGIYFVPVLTALSRRDYAVHIPVTAILAMGGWCTITFTFLFPDGRFVPRWMQLLAVGWGGLYILMTFYPPANPFNWPFLAILFILIFVVGQLCFAQIYRYLRVSSPVQRQQTKWFVYCATVSALAFVILNLDLLALLVPALSQPGLPLLVYNIVSLPIFLALLFLPSVGISIAILRYRLWDIDFIIRRTLIYGVLTAALLLVYVGSVVLLQFLFRALTGQQRSVLATVLSTAGIAALFAPLRQQIQNAIDRRFYRSRYDAAKTLEAFGIEVRNEVDLNQLMAELTAVVYDTMHPAHVSIWLRKTSANPDRKS